MRPGEAWDLRWTDIDSENSTVNILPEKDSRARQLRISARTAAMLAHLPHRYDYVFRNPKTAPLRSMEVFRRIVAKQRNKLADKLQNPRIKIITFKTLRHWKATTEYHKTRDILHVMSILGHKSIQNTLVYTHLINFEGDEYVCKVAKTVDDAKNLIENGFEYVTDISNSR